MFAKIRNPILTAKAEHRRKEPEKKQTRRQQKYIAKPFTMNYTEYDYPPVVGA